MSIWPLFSVWQIQNQNATSVCPSVCLSINDFDFNYSEISTPPKTRFSVPIEYATATPANNQPEPLSIFQKYLISSNHWSKRHFRHVFPFQFRFHLMLFFLSSLVKSKLFPLIQTDKFETHRKSDRKNYDEKRSLERNILTHFCAQIQNDQTDGRTCGMGFYWIDLVTTNKAFDRTAECHLNTFKPHACIAWLGSHSICIRSLFTMIMMTYFTKWKLHWEKHKFGDIEI